MHIKMPSAAIAVAAAALLAAPSHAAETDAAASAAQTSGWFANVGAGQSTFNHYPYRENDTAGQASFGYRWAAGPALFGVEAGYADLGNFRPKSSASVSGYDPARLRGYTLGVNTHVNVASHWYLSGRLGAFDWIGGRTYTDAAGVPVNYDHDNRGWGVDYYAGVGAGYDFNPHLSLGLNYDYFRAKQDTVNLSGGLTTVSAEYRF
ncbi:outer membrane protein [Mizugakiibacter sediminis]|uniref:Autotransporter n=1 Tax=Mizugakiibacter sediminis TaxID=1475481 RepID=A0A0U1PBH5_9GAMM|nr:outer membrane beta-barrel protein [Mizugakiibacter sediminis]